MKLLKRIPNLTYFLALGIFFYLFFIFADYYVYKQLFYSNVEAKLIEKNRQKKDFLMRNKAILDGFHTMVFPAIIENDENLMKIVESTQGLPLAPQPKTALYYCNEGYGLVTYTSDRFGFRNKSSDWDKKSIDILLIGDSYAHGACVKGEDTISNLLNKDFNVINVGTGGNSPIHYGALIKKIAPVIQPKNIFILFYPNDNDFVKYDNPYFVKYFIKNEPYFSTDKDGFLTLSDNIERSYKEIISYRSGLDVPILSKFISPNKEENWQLVYEKNKHHLNLRTLRNFLFNKISNYFNTNKGQLNWTSVLALNTLRSYCAEPNCTPHVIYIPNSEFWRPDGRALEYKKQLKKYTHSLGVDFIDSTDILKPLYNDAYALKGPHLSPEGYKAIAKEILNKIPK